MIKIYTRYISNIKHQDNMYFNVCYLWCTCCFFLSKDLVFKDVFYIFVTNSRAEPQKPRRWKSMLIHQGWFIALYTQHLLDSQSFEFEICIFPREAIPVTLLPPPRRLVPSLGLGTTWVRQPRSGSCHYPTAATKCNEQPSRATETPSVEKHAHPPRVVYCAIYSTLTRFTKFRV